MTNPTVTLRLNVNDVALIHALLEREITIGHIDAAQAEAEYQAQVARLLAITSRFV